MIDYIYNIRYKVVGFVIMMLAFMALPASAQNKSEAKVPKAQQHREQTVRPTYLDSLRMDSVKRMEEMKAALRPVPDSIAPLPDSTVSVTMADTLVALDSLMNLTSSELKEAVKARKQFVPDSKKALWLAIVFPGGGQIYNRKYWKLPIIYGGFLSCVYALNWNGTMYRDYSQAYIDIMDNDPNTKSFENFLPTNYNAEANMQYLKDLFKRKKDYYRRYRDLSLFCMIGVYALSVIDAYVDAELSSFDISHDLTMKVHPSVINNNSLAARSPYPSQAYGVKCSLSF